VLRHQSSWQDCEVFVSGPPAMVRATLRRRPPALRPVSPHRGPAARLTQPGTRLARPRRSPLRPSATGVPRPRPAPHSRRTGRAPQPA
jgi:hypothetical protein